MMEDEGKKISIETDGPNISREALDKIIYAIMAAVSPRPTDSFALRVAMKDGKLFLTDDAGRRVSNVQSIETDTYAPSGTIDFTARGTYAPAKHGVT